MIEDFLQYIWQHRLYLHESNLTTEVETVEPLQAGQVNMHAGPDFMDILDHYDVRIFPTCFLIDPEGKLVLSPAPAADDNLERTLWYELNGKGLWQEYIRKGWISVPGNQNKR